MRIEELYCKPWARIYLDGWDFHHDWRMAMGLLLLLCVDDTNFHCGSMAIYSLLCDCVGGRHFLYVFSVLDC